MKLGHGVLKSVPKVLLHEHLDGVLKPKTVIELAKNAKYKELPTQDPEELARWFHQGANQGSLAKYLEGFAHTIAVMQTEEALERVRSLGRRIYKSSSTATSIYALRDGDNLVEETNSSAVAVARYTQNLAIDAPLAMLRSGATSYYNADGLGSITSLTNGAGTLTQTYTLDSFGKQTA